MSEKIKYQTYGGIETAIDEYGNFSATVNDVFLQEQTWEGLRARIDNEKKAAAKELTVSLPCYCLVQTDDGEVVELLTLIGRNRNDSTSRWAERDKQAAKQIRVVLPATLRNQQLLMELAAAHAETVRINNEIRHYQLRDGYGRIEASDYEKCLVALRQWHEKGMAK